MNDYINQVSIKELILSEDFSIRSFNVCNDAGFKTLKDILEYYQKEKSFKKFRNCGVKTQKELQEICDKYLGKSFLKQPNLLIGKTTNANITSLDEDSDISQLVKCNEISIKTKTFCRRAQLKTLRNILEYYKKYKNFTKLPNINAKINYELIQLCVRYPINLDDSPRNQLNQVEIIENSNKLNDLNPFQKLTFNRHFEYLISNLDQRAYNGLLKISETNNPKEIIDAIFHKNFSFKKIQNIGDKTVKELDLFKSQLSSFIESLIEIPKDQLSRIYLKLILKNTFKEVPFDLDSTVSFIFSDNNKIKLFSLLELLINSGKLFTNVENSIFQNLFTKDISGRKARELIARENNISNERVRQKEVQSIKRLNRYFSFVSNFTSDDILNYDIDSSVDFHIIDKEIINKINSAEQVNFNFIFYGVIFGILLNKTHVVLGDDEVIFGKRETTNRKKYQNCYLIKSNIFNHFNFDTFVEDIYIKQNDKIREEYTLQFDGYLYEFINNQPTSSNLELNSSIKITSTEERLNFEELKEICKTILFLEFDIIIQQDGYLTFERNSKKVLSDYCYEILEKAGIPLRATQILEELIKDNPELKVTENSIRSSVHRDKDIFISFGRSSTYGLRKWEQEKSNIKGGTIREITEEYLKTQNVPIHISQIVTEIKVYRPNTNSKSVISNLKMDESGKFTIYEGEFVGLKSKIYSEEDTNYKKLIGFHFNLHNFDKMNGWDIEEVISYFANKHGYRKIQIKSIIENKIKDGELKIINNKLYL